MWRREVRLPTLGGDAPALAGLFALVLLHPTGEPRDYSVRLSGRPALRPLLSFIPATLIVALVWLYADAPVTAWAERIQSEAVQDWIRLTNRLGGGMNPAMVVIFFYLAGVACRCSRWRRYALAMTLAGAGAGLLAQIIKYAVGRTRPELWLGPFHHARASATSFPSGHTVGAFALAGILLFTSPSRTLRVVAVLLAAGVGLSRILAFRHWTSDVVASAAVGLIVAWSVSQLTRESQTLL